MTFHIFKNIFSTKLEHLYSLSFIYFTWIEEIFYSVKNGVQNVEV